MQFAPEAETDEAAQLEKLKLDCLAYVDACSQVAELALVPTDQVDEKRVASLFNEKRKLSELIAMRISKLALPTDFFDLVLKAC